MRVLLCVPYNTFTCGVGVEIAAAAARSSIKYMRSGLYSMYEARLVIFEKCVNHKMKGDLLNI